MIRECNVYISNLQLLRWCVMYLIMRIYYICEVSLSFLHLVHSQTYNPLLCQKIHSFRLLNGIIRWLHRDFEFFFFLFFVFFWLLFNVLEWMENFYCMNRILDPDFFFQVCISTHFIWFFFSPAVFIYLLLMSRSIFWAYKSPNRKWHIRHEYRDFYGKSPNYLYPWLDKKEKFSIWDGMWRETKVYSNELEFKRWQKVLTPVKWLLRN